MRKTKYLPLGLKVALVATSFSLPIVVLVYFVITNINVDIRFRTLESAGNAYQRPLEKLLDEIQQFQIVVTDPVPGNSNAKHRDELATAIGSSFATLADVDKQLGTSLQFTDEGLKKRQREHLTVGQLTKHWQAIAGNRQDAAVADLSADLDKLVASLREMITHTGDTSNLILDPDLDSYYLMDVTLLALPQVQDRLAKVIAFGRDRLQASQFSGEDRVQLAVFATMLEEADVARVKSSLATSLNEDANFYGVSPTLAKGIGPANEEFLRTTADFIALVRRAAGEQPDLDAAAFVAAGLKARDASFSLWNKSVAELDKLLATRVQDHVNSRSVALTGAGIALAISCAMAWLVTRSITKPLQKLAESLGPGANLLNNSVEMLAESPENVDIICEELTAQVGYMRRAVQQLVVVVRGGAVSSAPQSTTPAKKPDRQLVEV